MEPCETLVTRDVGAISILGANADGTFDSETALGQQNLGVVVRGPVSSEGEGEGESEILYTLPVGGNDARYLLRALPKMHSKDDIGTQSLAWVFKEWGGDLDDTRNPIEITPLQLANTNSLEIDVTAIFEPAWVLRINRTKRSR